MIRRVEQGHCLLYIIPLNYHKSIVKQHISLDTSHLGKNPSPFAQRPSASPFPRLLCITSLQRTSNVANLLSNFIKLGTLDI